MRLLITSIDNHDRPLDSALATATLLRQAGPPPPAPRFLRRGFTLVELLVVITIIGILMAILMPAVNAAREYARATQCKNHLKQIGIGFGIHEQQRHVLPSGWASSRDYEAEGPPGWGWGAYLLPFIEENHAFQRIRFDLPIADPANAEARMISVATYVCPSDAETLHFTLEFEDGGAPLEIARAGYVGVFGDTEIEDSPSRGRGMFFHNSRLSVSAAEDGASHTLFVGERSSRVGGSTWVGVIPGAEEAMARVVGATDHLPNSEHIHLDDFSSEHPLGAHFLLGDGSVRMIDDSMDLVIYQAMATRRGREVVQE